MITESRDIIGKIINYKAMSYDELVANVELSLRELYYGRMTTKKKLRDEINIVMQNIKGE